MAIRGAGTRHFERAAFLVLGDLILQLLLVGFGLALLFEPEVLTDPASIAGAPSLEDMVFAFPLVLVAFSGIDASSGLAGQVAIGRTGLRRLIGVRLVAAMVPYLGIALVAAPCCRPPAASSSRRRCWGSPTPSSRPGSASRAKYLVAISAVVILISAAQAAMLGLSRLGYALAVNRQIPSQGGLAEPHARDAGRDHRLRRGDGDLPADPRRPRVPGRDLRVRGDDRVHDRRRLGRLAALQGARARPPVPDAAQRPRSAADRCRSRPCCAS